LAAAVADVPGPEIPGGNGAPDGRRMAANDRGDLVHREQRAFCLNLWHLVSPSKA
jgi:hypothetical protein